MLVPRQWLQYTLPGGEADLAGYHTEFNTIIMQALGQ